MTITTSDVLQSFLTAIKDLHSTILQMILKLFFKSWGLKKYWYLLFWCSSHAERLRILDLIFPPIFLVIKTTKQRNESWIFSISNLLANLNYHVKAQKETAYVKKWDTFTFLKLTASKEDTHRGGHHNLISKQINHFRFHHIFAKMSTSIKSSKCQTFT